MYHTQSFRTRSTLSSLAFQFSFALTAIAHIVVPDRSLHAELVFTPLGTIGGGTTTATGVSDDGNVIVGRTGGGVTEAFRWTAMDGLIGLGDLPGGDSWSRGTAVSGDGFTIVGDATVDGPANFGRRQAFSWTASGGMAAVPGLNALRRDSFATGVSRDGSVVVGREVVPGRAAFKWSSQTGVTYLQDLNTLDPDSYAYAVSPDGTGVGGRSQNASGILEATIWNASGAATGIGHLNATDTSSVIYDLSNDGSIAVGDSTGGTITRAFMWTQGDGMVDILGTAGFEESQADAITPDGLRIVGRSFNASESFAYVWDEQNGAQSIKEILQNAGIDMTGWQLDAASGISADGTVIVGYGTNPSGQREAWRATINGVPEPSAGLLLLVVGASTACLRRRCIALRPQ